MTNPSNPCPTVHTRFALSLINAPEALAFPDITAIIVSDIDTARRTLVLLDAPFGYGFAAGCEARLRLAVTP